MATESVSPTVGDLQAEIAAAREDLLASIADLRGQATPAALGNRALANVKGFFIDDDGAPRVKNIAITAGVVVGVIAVRAIFRRR